MCLQLHNLPIELWDRETLNNITEPIKIFLKIDEFTLSLARAHYARLCVELDLSRPLKKDFWLEDNEYKVFVVILYKRFPTFCYLCCLVGQGTNGCSRRSESSPVDQVMDDAPEGGNLPNNPRSISAGSQVRQVAAQSSDTQAYNLEANDTREFGLWMLATHWRNKGKGRGAGFSSALGSHMRQGGMDDMFPTIQASRDEANLDEGCNGQHMKGRGSSSLTRGGHRARGGGRGGLSHHSSNSLAPFSLSKETLIGFGPNANLISDCSNICFFFQWRKSHFGY